MGSWFSFLDVLLITVAIVQMSNHIVSLWVWDALLNVSNLSPQILLYLNGLPFPSPFFATLLRTISLIHIPFYSHSFIYILNPSQYYARASEAESWMNDKKPLVAHRQYGKDEDSTQALIKKQEAIELEIDGYNVKVADLEAESQRMLSKEHFDSDTIRERQVTQHMQASLDR